MSNQKTPAFALMFLLCIGFIVPGKVANAWNDRTHMLIAYLAFQEMSPDQREAIHRTLRDHPHYTAYLSRERPENCAEDLWVFMRAATWPDFVNSNEHRAEFHRGKWHYVNHVYDPRQPQPESRANQPPASPNILNALDECYDLLVEPYPTAARKAMAIAWIEHLVGDLHQPLHCVNLYSEKFPTGDQGGNKIAVRDGEKVTRLHAYWDNVLGDSKDFEEIVALAMELRAGADNSAAASEQAKPLSWAAWSDDGFALASKYVYLNGQLPLTEWRKEMQDGGFTDDVPTLPGDYPTNAKELARLQVKLAARRLANVLASVIK